MVKYKKGHPLNYMYRFLTWDRYIRFVAGLNILVSDQKPQTLGQFCEKYNIKTILEKTNYIGFNS